MKCLRCGSTIEDDAKECKYCGYQVGSNAPLKNQEIKENKKEYKYEKYQQQEDIEVGFENFNISAIGHLLLALGTYFGVSVVYTLIGRLFIRIYVAIKGISVKDIPDSTLTLIETVLQVVVYVMAIATVILILRKTIKKVFAEFKMKSTWLDALKYCALMYASLYVYGIVLTLLGVESSSENQKEVNEMIFSYPFLAFLFVGILAPIFEEIVFRLGIFRAISFKNSKIALIVTTILFASIHMTLSLVNGTFMKDIYSLPSYLIGAFFITYSYYKSKKLATSICVHSIYNTLSFILILISPYIQPSSEIIRLFLK